MSSILDALRKHESRKAASRPFDPVAPGGPRPSRQGRGWMIAFWAMLMLVFCLAAAVGGVYLLSRSGWISVSSSQRIESSGPAVPETGAPAQAPGEALEVLPVPTATPEPTAVPPTPSWTATPSSTPTPIPSETASPTPLDEEELPVVTEDGLFIDNRNGAGVRRRPTRAALQLNGIMYDPRQPMAIVNGKLVGVGDEVGGFRVKEITRSGVRLDGYEGELRLSE